MKEKKTVKSQTLKDRNSDASKKESIKKHFSLSSRIKTAVICLPILIFMVYFKLLYTLLMIIVIFFTYSEFYTIEKNILKLLFKNDHFSDITWNTLISSPLFTIFFMMCPLILYFFENGEILACIVTLSLVILWRIKNFILVYNFLFSPINLEKLIKDKEFCKKELSDEIQIMDNPMNYFLKNQTKEASTTDINKSESNMTQQETRGENFYYTYTDTTKISSEEFSSTKFSNFQSLKVFNSCLVLIMLDITYFFLYVFPLCLGISIHNFKNSFVHLIMIVVIAYQSDNGALFAGNKFGKVQFGYPVTPNKTLEGIYGAYALGIVSAFVYRYIIINVFNIEMMGFIKFTIYLVLSVTSAIFGDFIESFLKRCANLKDSGNLLPGHGGLLDRVDSLTLCVPVAYYFLLTNN